MKMTDSFMCIEFHLKVGQTDGGKGPVFIRYWHEMSLEIV